MEGGRLLGSGTYGCVFQPPLLCKSRGHVNGKKVAKVEEKDEAEQEVKISNQLRTMPLVDNYFILNDPESCEIAPLDKQKNKNTTLCETFEETPVKELRQIYAPFGGYQTFYRVLTTSDLHPKRFDFFAFSQHLLEAGATLALAGVCHYDIHPGNLLVDTNGVVRIIDFGLSFLKSDINKDMIEDNWKIWAYNSVKNHNPVILNQEPPEVTIWNGIRKGHSLQQAVEIVTTLKPIFRDMTKYLGISRTECEQQLMQFWETSKATQEKDAVKLFQLYWPGFDAWGIGCILLYVLKASLSFTIFTEGVWKERQAAVYAAIRGLLDVNPRTRLDSVEALATFDPNSAWIQRFGEKWLAAREKQRAAFKAV